MSAHPQLRWPVFRKEPRRVREEKVFTAQGTKVFTVVVTPDCKYIVSGSSDGTIKVWTLDTGKCNFVLKGDSKSVNSIAMLRDGRFVSGGEDGIIKIFDAKTGKLHSEFEKQYSAITCLTVTKDNRYVIAGLNSGTLISYRLKTGTTVQSYEPHPAQIGFSGLISCSNREFAYNDYLSNLEYAHTYSNEDFTFFGHAGAISSVSVTTNAKYIVSGSRDDDTIRLWNLKTGICLWIFGGYHWENSAGIYATAITPNDRRAISGSGHISIWRLGWSQKLFPGIVRFMIWRFILQKPSQILNEFDGLVKCIAFMPKGRKIVVAQGWHGKVCIVKLRNGVCTHFLQGHDGEVNDIAVLPDNRVVTGADDGTVRLWKL